MLALVALAVADPLPDGIVIAPQLGASYAHFSQPPGDEGPQAIVGPTIGIFVGGREHAVIFGVAFDHTQGLYHTEEGYPSNRTHVRVERVAAQVGYGLRYGNYAVVPTLAVGFFDSDIPFFNGDLVGVTGKVALGVDYEISPQTTIGVMGALDLGIAPTHDRTATSYGATVSARMSFTL